MGSEMGYPEVFGVLPHCSGQHSLGIRAVFLLVGASRQQIGTFAGERFEPIEERDRERGERNYVRLWLRPLGVARLEQFDRNGPQFFVQIEMRPPGESQLAPALAGD